MRLAILLGCVSLLAGCGPAGALAPLYSGSSGERVAENADVTIEEATPPEAFLVGEVLSRCRADDGALAIEDESLADVDCSDALLVAALREKAASVGGTALVGLRCVATDESRGDLLASKLHSCSALVATPRAGRPAMSTEGRSPAAFVPPYDEPRQAFRVRVTLVPPGVHAPRRWAVPSDAVAELAVMPPHRVLVGDIVATCDDGCNRAVVRHAVRAATGRVGGTEVVGIACAKTADGWLCTGRAARPEVDEVAAR